MPSEDASERGVDTLAHCEGCDEEVLEATLQHVEMKHGGEERLCPDCIRDSWGAMSR